MQWIIFFLSFPPLASALKRNNPVVNRNIWNFIAFSGLLSMNNITMARNSNPLLILFSLLPYSLWSDFHIIDNLSIVVYAFTRRMLTSFSVDEIWLPRYVKWSILEAALPENSCSDELISDILLWTPTYGYANVGRATWTCISSMWTLCAVERTGQERFTVGIDGKRERERETDRQTDRQIEREGRKER